MHVIIIGAGPTGLTAGIELARRGVRVEIIDKKELGSTLSRAVGINPCSLKILEASGVTEKLLAQGIPYYAAHIYHADKPWVTLKLTDASPMQYGYNFMLGLPQDETETILREAFIKLDGVIHYNTELKHITQEDNAVSITTNQGGKLKGDYLIGADGAHSMTRQCINIPSKHIELPETWSIADIDAHDKTIKNSVSLYLLKHGRMAFIAPIGEHRFRLISNTKRVIDTIPVDLNISNIRREGNFKVTIAQVKSYQKGRVFLAGDAAHTHSPAGGRGMNLGIADAADLAEKLLQNKEVDYTQSRHQEGKKIIAGSEMLRKILSTTNPLTHGLILIMFKLIASISPLRKKFANKFLYG
jgi:2-polyprenyl-6-methoxyphenol hydroxylase-like FAD-dependent oxidoreductase